MAKVVISTDLNQALLSYAQPNQPCVLLPATHTSCGSLWEKESHAGATPRLHAPLSLVPGTPGTEGHPLVMFRMKNVASGQYLAPQYVANTSMSDSSTNASTMFIVQANGTKTDALLCALVQIQADQGLQTNTLLVWLNADDPEPKALCMGSGSAMRVYADPIPCAGDAGVSACGLTWQACNPASGYCFDAAWVRHMASTPPTDAIQVSQLAFPNCPSRRVAGVFEAPFTACLAPSDLHKHIAAHKSPAVASNAPRYHEEIQTWTHAAWIIGGLLVVCAVWVAWHMWTRATRKATRKARRRAKRRTKRKAKHSAG